jgi:hypothetical protein
MNHYYVNDRAQANGDHEVHTVDCTYLPAHRTYLGSFMSCHGAVLKARETYTHVNGCAFCSSACHTG